MKYTSCIGCTDYKKNEIGKERESEGIGKEPKMEEKTCTKCGIKKNIDLFYKQAASKDGHQAYCKKCVNLAIAIKNGASGKTNSKTHRPEESLPVVPDSAPVAEPVKTQACSRCKKELPLTAEYFHRCSSHVSGFREACKTCRAESRPDTKSEVRVVLNFENEPDLHERVLAMAKKERRNIDQQILCVLDGVAV